MAERIDSLHDICRRFQIDILYAFGSRSEEATGWLGSSELSFSVGASDLDIGAKPLPGVLWRAWDKVDMALALEHLFGCDRVDLVSMADADPYLAAEIIRGERLYARDSYRADEYELYVLRREADLEPLERARIRQVLRLSQ